MLPEEHRTIEPEYSPTHDRKFSELPVEDRWQLIRDAVSDLHYEDNYRFPAYSIASVCGFSLGITVAGMVSYTPVPASKLFLIWVVCHSLFISALLFAMFFVGSRSRKCAAQISQLLSTIEQTTLSPKLHE